MTGLINCTLECNLKCEYCFEGQGDSNKCPDVKNVNDLFVEALDKFDKYIDEIYKKNGNEKTPIIFHGGEPTLIRPENLERLMKLQAEKKHNISWRIQTNGTLISDELIKVFKKYNVNVGISIDGLKKHHDRYRVTKNDKPTFDIVYKNMKRLKESEVPFSVLVTITNNNVLDLIDIYKFLAVENISFSFNALYPRKNTNDSADLSPELFSEEICNLFDCWIEDQTSKIIIAPFEQIIEGLFMPSRGIPACNWQKQCTDSFMAIDTEGRIFPCEHWVNNINMAYANINEDFEKIYIKAKNVFKERVDNLEINRCDGCSIYDLCYGGCPWNAYMVTGSMQEKDESICVGRKVLIKHIYDYMKINYKGNLPERDFTD